MPNRILREGILTSERVNKLSPQAELFYRRLMSVVDDFGRYSANLTLLRTSCYPLLVDRVDEKQISKHLAEAQAVGLILTYHLGDKSYVELRDFRQQRRAKKSKWPAPEDASTTDNKPVPPPDQQMHSRDIATDVSMITSEHLVEGERREAERERAQKPSGVLPTANLARRISALRPEWHREDHQWTATERLLLDSVRITETDMNRLETRFAAGKGKSRKLRWFLENWTDELADDPRHENTSRSKQKTYDRNAGTANANKASDYAGL